MTIPAWCKVKEENYRIEVSQSGITHPKDLENLADRLSDLFDEHSEWKGTRAEVNYDEVTRCNFCGEIYVPQYDPEKAEEYCENCGKGKLEWAIKILDDANKSEVKK